MMDTQTTVVIDKSQTSFGERLRSRIEEKIEKSQTLELKENAITDV